MQEINRVDESEKVTAAEEEQVGTLHSVPSDQSGNDADEERRRYDDD